MAKPKYAFIIRYKSGSEVPVRADKLSVKWNTTHGVATEMTWTNMQPSPMAIGLSNIESVWQVD